MPIYAHDRGPNAPCILEEEALQELPASDSLRTVVDPLPLRRVSAFL